MQLKEFTLIRSVRLKEFTLIRSIGLKEFTFSVETHGRASLATSLIDRTAHSGRNGLIVVEGGHPYRGIILCYKNTKSPWD